MKSAYYLVLATLSLIFLPVQVVTAQQPQPSRSSPSSKRTQAKEPGIPVKIQNVPNRAAVQDGVIKNQFSLDVHHEGHAVEPFLSVHRKVAQTLTDAQLPPPDHRIEYFRSLYNEKSPPVKGWHAFVVNVQPIEGGVIATLRVSAKLEYLSDSAFLYEKYSIINGKVRYLDAFIPNDNMRLIIH